MPKQLYYPEIPATLEQAEMLSRKRSLYLAEENQRVFMQGEGANIKDILGQLTQDLASSKNSNGQVFSDYHGYWTYPETLEKEISLCRRSLQEYKCYHPVEVAGQFDVRCGVCSSHSLRRF